MNKNMRKMYTEEQVVSLIKKAMESGEISGGTKLYKHTISLSNANIVTWNGLSLTYASGFIISTKSTPIPFNQLLNNDDGDKLHCFINFNDYEIIMYVRANGTNTVLFLDNQSGTISFDGVDTYGTGEVYKDTVTPL